MSIITIIYYLVEVILIIATSAFKTSVYLLVTGKT